MKNTDFSPCVIIPVYNHHLALADLCSDVLDAGIDLIFIDDGSDEITKQCIESLVQNDGVYCVSRSTNGGKGAAVKTGLQAARTLAYSHALQIDADGQHNTDDLKAFSALAEDNPSSLILGYPEYDESVPRHRFYARYLTHVWVWINTLSFQIKDSMCGFRVYPVEQSCELIAASHIGNRMDFDTEFVVRWSWASLPISQRSTKVNYPAGGVSHFRLFLDNALISKMHAKLFFGMLFRIPLRLYSRLRLGRG